MNQRHHPHPAGGRIVADHDSAAGPPALVTLTILLVIVLSAARLLAQPAQPGAEADVQTLPVSVERSRVVRPPWPVKRVSVADPTVADVQVVSPTQVLVVGKSVGSTDLLLWSEQDELWEAVILVEADTRELREELNRLFPTAELELVQTRDLLVVSGALRHAEEAERLETYLEKSGRKYANLTGVAGVHQVMIHVRVAEASRQAIRALGINAVHANAKFFGASTIGGNPNQINAGIPEGAPAGKDLPFSFLNDTSVSPSLTLFGGFPGSDLQVFIEALAENQYMRTLAEPTLIALSGEEANFLAGGEFPIPVVQSSGGGGGTSISVQFKEFGVRLSFRPTVLGDGTIRLYVAPEVSDISDVGAVVIENFRIPALVSRRAETTLQMKSGQTFALAGLLDRSVSARTSKVPGLGSIPVIGSLFRSIRYERGDTELVVLATVSLVEPLSGDADRPLPGELHQSPDDWRLYMDGEIEGAAPRQTPAHAQWIQEMGLNNLKGPGAWAEHDDAAVSRRIPLRSAKRADEAEQADRAAP
jgi:pilus assembly protein CpaC